MDIYLFIFFNTWKYYLYKSIYYIINVLGAKCKKYRNILH